MNQSGGLSEYNEILLIDDDPIDLFINEKILTAFQFAIKINKCNSAQAALNMLAERLEKEQAFPDIIFLDYFMPLMDGAAFIEKFAEMEKTFNRKIQVNIVVLTAIRNMEEKNVFSESPYVLSVVNKPLNEKILQKIDEMILKKIQ